MVTGSRNHIEKAESEGVVKPSNDENKRVNISQNTSMDGCEPASNRKLPEFTFSYQDGFAGESPLSTPTNSLLEKNSSNWPGLDGNSATSDDDCFSDSTGSVSRAASTCNESVKTGEETPKNDEYSHSIDYSSTYRKSTSSDLSDPVSPKSEVMSSIYSSSSPSSSELKHSYSAGSFQIKSSYNEIENSSYKTLKHTSSVSSGLRRRHRKSINTHFVTPKVEYDYTKPRMKGEVHEIKPDDDEFFRRIEIEWREQDRELNQPASWLSTIIWFPFLAGLRMFNVFYYFSFTPISIVWKTLFGMDLKWEPVWNVSLEAKKQATTVFAFIMLLPAVTMAYFMALIMLLFPLTTIPMLLYILFIFRWDNSHIDGSRRPFLRYWKLWRHFVNYFPCRLIKTHNLDPEQKYLFCYHPHGIISMGVFGNFATDASGFSRKFPGIDLRVLTLQMNFYAPWVREFLLHMGICSCAKRACDKMLNRGKGSAILLVVGGAEESLHVAPGTYRLTLGGRKGFVRAALDNGANLVPVLGFGENDAYNTYVCPKGSWSRWIQEKFKKKFGFATPIFYGNGICFWMPLRTPIIAVVGKPIPVPKVPPHLRGKNLRKTEEGRQLVDTYHKMYIDSLKSLYDTYKDRWALNRHESLLLVQQNKN